MVSTKEMSATFQSISNIPFVKRALNRVLTLEKENKGLVKEINTLKQMIDILLNKSVIGNAHCCGCVSNQKTHTNPVKVKEEAIDLTTDTETTVGENIVYELIHDDSPIKSDEVIVTIPDEEDKEEVEEEEEEVEVEEEEEEGEVEEEEEEVEVEEEEEEVEVEEEEEEVEVEEEEEVEVEEEEEEEEVEVEVEEEEEVEVEVEEEEEEVEVEVEEEEEDEVEVEEEEEEAEGEEEVYEVIINNKSYYTTNEVNGPIYAIDADEEIGDEIGEFKNGKAVFFKTKK